MMDGAKYAYPARLFVSAGGNLPAENQKYIPYAGTINPKYINPPMNILSAE